MKSFYSNLFPVADDGGCNIGCTYSVDSHSQSSISTWLWIALQLRWLMKWESGGRSWSGFEFWSGLALFSFVAEKISLTHLSYILYMKRASVMQLYFSLIKSDVVMRLMYAKHPAKCANKIMMMFNWHNVMSLMNIQPPGHRAWMHN